MKSGKLIDEKTFFPKKKKVMSTNLAPHACIGECVPS